MTDMNVNQHQLFFLFFFWGGGSVGGKYIQVDQEGSTHRGGCIIHQCTHLAAFVFRKTPRKNRSKKSPDIDSPPWFIRGKHVEDITFVLKAIQRQNHWATEGLSKKRGAPVSSGTLRTHQNQETKAGVKRFLWVLIGQRTETEAQRRKGFVKSQKRRTSERSCWVKRR